MKRVFPIILLVIIMLAPMLAQSIVSADTGEEYDVEINVVKVLGIMSDKTDGNFAANDKLTRGELAQLLINLCGISNVPITDNITKLYTDVPTSHKNAAAIEYVTVLGIMRGYIDSTFRADNSVSLNEMAMATVTALGYGEMVNAKGGYPVGALIVAKEYKILNGVDINVETVSRGLAAKIAYNALFAPVIKRDITANVTKYNIDNTTNLLANVYNTYRVIGQVIGVGGTTLTGSSSLKENDVVIQVDGGEKETFDTNGVDYSQYLGYWVEAYVRYDNAENAIIYMSARKDINNVISINARDINHDASTKTEIVYSTENTSKRSSVKISPIADCIYNGIAYFDFTLNDILPAKGKLDLLDNNGDGIADIIFVTDFQTIVVGSVDPILKKVYDKYSTNSVCLDPDASDTIVKIYKGNSEVKFSDIKAWDVLECAVSKSPGRKMIKVYISDAKVSGNITEIIGITTKMIEDQVTKETTEITVADNDAAIVVNGTTYKLDDRLLQRIRSKQETLQLDMSGTYYLDIYGYIAAIDKTSLLKFKYAYLISMAAAENGLSNPQVKLYTANGQFKIFTFRDKITYNGIQGYSSNKLASKDVANNITGFNPLYKTTKDSQNNEIVELLPQLVTYDTNSEGIITEFNTASTASYNTTNVDSAIFSFYGGRQYTRRYGNSSAFYNPSTGIDMFLTSKTIVFVVPKDDLKAEEYFRITNYNQFSKDNDYDVSGYDANANGQVSVVVQKVGTTTGNVRFNDRQSAFIVDSVTEIINNKGELVQKINGFYKGAPKSIIGAHKYSTQIKFVEGSPTSAPNSNLINAYMDLQKGDVINYTTDKSGLVDDVALMFSPHGRPYVTTDGKFGRLPFKKVYGSKYIDVLYKIDGATNVLPPPGVTIKGYSVFPVSSTSSSFSNDPNADFQAIYGKVLERNGDFVTVGFDEEIPKNTSTEKYYGNKMTYNIANSKVYVYYMSNSNNKIIVGSKEDLAKDDEVFLQNTNLSIPCVFVIKK